MTGYGRRAPRSYQRGQVRIPIERGKLTKFGYSTKKNDRSRHATLNKAVKAYGPASVLRKLEAQVILKRNTRDKDKMRVRKVFDEDADWVRSEHL